MCFICMATPQLGLSYALIIHIKDVYHEKIKGPLMCILPPSPRRIAKPGELSCCKKGRIPILCRLLCLKRMYPDRDLMWSRVRVSSSAVICVALCEELCVVFEQRTWTPISNQRVIILIKEYHKVEYISLCTWAPRPANFNPCSVEGIQVQCQVAFRHLWNGRWNKSNSFVWNGATNTWDLKWEDCCAPGYFMNPERTHRVCLCCHQLP